MDVLAVIGLILVLMGGIGSLGVEDSPKQSYTPAIVLIVIGMLMFLSYIYFK